MPRVTLNVRDLKKARRAVERAERRASIERVQRVIEPEAAKVLDAARRKVPHRTGKLHDKIKMKRGRSNKRVVISVGVRDVLRTGRDKSTDRAHVAKFQEFGTVNHPPHPFLRPAFYENRDEALRRIKEGLTEFVLGG